MFNARSKASPKQKKIVRIAVVCFVVLCLLVEVLGRIPGIPFNGWRDVFSLIGMTQPPTIAQNELQVHFIDVGHADCMLVRQGEHNMLIDTGESTYLKLLTDYLDRHEIEKLDLVISTHPHGDHMGMMTEVIQHVEVERFVMSYMPEGEEPTLPAYWTMLEALDECGAVVEEAKPGATYALGDAAVQILAPLPLDEPIEDANQISVVARLTFGEHAFLFTGDAEEDLEERMVASGCDLSADVLKVAHHGSNTSTSPAFLKAVSPQYAVITCGKNNYGHPTTEVVTRLVEANAQIFRTDVHGDIVFTSDGRELSVKTEKTIENARSLSLTPRVVAMKYKILRTAVQTAVLYFNNYLTIT